MDKLHEKMVHRRCSKRCVLIVLIVLAILYAYQFILYDKVTIKALLYGVANMRISIEKPVGIPRIIHQTWSSRDVPNKTATWIQSWIKHNPDWEYWFWTDEDSSRFVHQRYPQYVAMFEKYDLSIKRADAIRYLILREFGGLYVDLDMQCLSALDDWVSMFSCFLCEENYEHQILIYQRRDPIIINSIMGCRASHPMFDDAMRALPLSAHEDDVLKATGPLFLTGVYNNFTNGKSTIQNYVTVIPPRYLMPLPDPSQRLPLFIPYCKKLFKKNTSTKNQDHSKIQSTVDYNDTNRIPKVGADLDNNKRELEVCRMLQRTNYNSTIHNESLTVHYWMHTMLNTTKWQRFLPVVPITKLAPEAKFYTMLYNDTQKSLYYSKHNNQGGG